MGIQAFLGKFFQSLSKFFDDDQPVVESANTISACGFNVFMGLGLQIGLPRHCVRREDQPQRLGLQDL